MPQSSLPNFLLIGAQKCGTSWLANKIRQHPDVFAPEEKELHFFDKRKAYSQGLSAYRDCFNGYNGQNAIGEFTPNYFWTQNTAAEIAESDLTSNVPELVHRHLPDAKLILCLRDPVQRAISAYFHLVKNGRLSPSQSFERVKHRFGIVSMGYYAKHLENWLEYYPREKILILIYENDIKNNKVQTLKRIYNFLDVEDQFTASDVDASHNSRETHFSIRLRHLVKSHRLRSTIQKITPHRLKQSAYWEIKLTPAEINWLKKEYLPYNQQLAKLLDIELPWSYSEKSTSAL